MIDTTLFIDSFPQFLAGMGTSLQIAAAGACLGMLLGFFLAFGEKSKKFWIRWPSHAYTYLFRGTPMLVQILFFYYTLPQTGVSLSPKWTAALAIGLNSAAYLSQVFSTGLKTISKGQIEAGKTLGLTPFQMARYLFIPQMFRKILPALGNEWIVLIKDSSLASVIGVVELSKVASMVRGRTYDAFTPLFSVALIYLLLTAILSLLLKKIEKRHEKPLSWDTTPAEATHPTTYKELLAVPVLTVSNLAKSFSNKPLFNNVSFSLNAGEVGLLPGPSGSGKSTLLRLICGLETQDQGEIKTTGQTGFVFQEHHLFDHLDVQTNIILPLVLVKKMPLAQAKGKALALLKRFDLEEKAKCCPSTLSGGQKQRVALARTLALEPEIICFDEPTSSLDSAATQVVASTLLEIANEGKALVVTTHDEILKQLLGGKLRQLPFFP